MHNLLLLRLGIIATLLVMIASPTMAQKSTANLTSSSPLASCSNGLNCTNRAFTFAIPASDLVTITDQVLREHKYLDSLSQVSTDPYRIEAVFRAASFKDDVQIVINTHEMGSILYIRSASREGNYDLGVNKRRVRGIIKTIRKQL